MRGKYSPTVAYSYRVDQEWWHKYSRDDEKFTLYDPEGFDSYGYDCNDMDRAGNYEYQYYHDDNGCGENSKYTTALATWTFDGVKPLRK